MWRLISTGRRCGLGLAASLFLAAVFGAASPASAQVTYRAFLDDTQITPTPSGSTSSGQGYVYHYADNTLRYDFRASGLSQVLRAEIRTGGWGTAGALVATLSFRPGFGAWWQGTTAPLSGAQVTALTRHELYVIVFTNFVAYPNGEIRGQIVRPTAIAARYGNVNSTPTSPTPQPVLRVNGSVGHGYYCAMTIPAGPATIDLDRPPLGGSGTYLFWIFSGESHQGTLATAFVNDGSGNPLDLGLSPVCMPITNTLQPGICPCSSLALPGFTSRVFFGAPLANALCVAQGAATAPAPATLAVNLAPGLYTVAGILHDPSKSTLPQRFSVINSIVLRVL